MTDKHLTDQMIQEYLWEPEKLDPAAQAHVAVCEHCQSLAAGYRLLFSGVTKIKQPQFDFDLAESVMQFIPRIQAEIQSQTELLLPGAVKKAVDPDKRKIAWPLLVVSVLAAIVIAVAVYMMWDTIGNIVAGSSLVLTYLVIMIVVLIMAFLGFEEFRKYNNQLNNLEM